MRGLCWSDVDAAGPAIAAAVQLLHSATVRSDRRPASAQPLRSAHAAVRNRHSAVNASSRVRSPPAAHANSLRWLWLRRLSLRPAVAFVSRVCSLIYAALEGDKESNWLLAPVNVIVRQLRLSSYGADSALVSSSSKARHMVEVQDVLKRFLSIMITDRSPAVSSKKQGCLFIIVHLFKLYFKLNSLNLGASLVKVRGKHMQARATCEGAALRFLCQQRECGLERCVSLDAHLLLCSSLCAALFVFVSTDGAPITPPPYVSHRTTGGLSVLFGSFESIRREIRRE